ncbi:MAG TPA: adenylate/guanylate cyclase domain-containing protein [Spirochaetia bacterium]|nr:adenylate/guanylate cyclase domain-containing protein [Spirochaetia bacterium]
MATSEPSPQGRWLRYSLLALLIAATAALTRLAWSDRGGLTASAFQRRMPLKNPVSVAWDGKDHLYALDDRFFRILELTADGRVVRQFYAHSVDPRHYEYWEELAVDGDGVLYAAKVEYFIDSELIDSEQICRYPPGGAEQILYTVHHEGDTEAYDSRLLTLQIKGGWLYFDVRAPDQVALWRLPLAGGNAEQVLVIPAKKEDVYNLAGTAPGQLWITSYSGDRVWRLTTGGKLQDAAFQPAAPQVPPIVLADKVVTAPGGDLFITDLFNQCIYRVRPGQGLELWLGKSDLPDHPERALFKDIWATPDGGLAAVDVIWRQTGARRPAAGEGGRLVLFDPARRLLHEVTSPVPSLSLWLRLLQPWGAVFGAGLCFIGLLVFVYLVILGRRLSVMLKLILAFVPLVVGSIAFVSTTTFSRSSAKVEEEIRYRLASLAQTGQLLINGDAVDRIRRPADYLGEDYNAVAQQLQKLINSAKDPWNQRLFADVAKLYNGMFYIMDDSASTYGVLYPLPVAPSQEYKAALQGTGPRTYEYTDTDGTFLEAAAPIRNHQGTAVAVLYVGSSKDDLDLLQAEFRRGVIQSTALATALLLVAITGVSLFLLLSVNRLRGAVGRMAGGEWGAEVTIRSRDEIGELGQGFNTMSRYLRGYISEITSMSDAYARFVPREFLRFLSKEKVADIELGNQVEMDMAILFADIRSFTTISEKMRPQENFNFLNSYLSRMGPVVRRHRGFIDKYLGDGIMALFPAGAESAVRAAVDMQRELVTYNRHRARSGYQPIAVGIGVHSGKVMLGILGEKERMEGTVIADAVNLASRLEGLTKIYGAWIIVAEDVVKALGSRAPEHRFLGRVAVKGRSEPVSICEVFAADGPRDIQLKRRTRKVFEEGVRLYLEGNLVEARRYFGTVHQVHPEDLVAAYYASQSEGGNGTDAPRDAVSAEEATLVL